MVKPTKCDESIIILAVEQSPGKMDLTMDAVLHAASSPNLINSQIFTSDGLLFTVGLDIARGKT